MEIICFFVSLPREPLVNLLARVSPEKNLYSISSGRLHVRPLVYPKSGFMLFYQRENISLVLNYLGNAPGVKKSITTSRRHSAHFHLFKRLQSFLFLIILFKYLDSNIVQNTVGVVLFFTVKSFHD